MKVIEIQKELKERNLRVTGNKAELLSRLRKGLSDKVPVGAKKADRTEKKASNSLAAAFLSTVFWKPLVALEDIIVELKKSSFRKPLAPNINADQAEFVPVKHNFTDIFDRPEFKGGYEEFERGPNVRVELYRTC